jgi:hypothetical protein
VIEPARYPTFSFPVAGPYPIVRMAGSNVDIRTREGRQSVHLDRVVRCPTTLPSGVAWVTQRVNPPVTKRSSRLARPMIIRDGSVILARSGGT